MEYTIDKKISYLLVFESSVSSSTENTDVKEKKDKNQKKNVLLFESIFESKGCTVSLRKKRKIEKKITL